MIEDLTIIIKTFERPDSLNRCLTSIRKLYNDVKVIVADDSKEPLVNTLANEYYSLPFDSGLSRGRNFLLTKVNSKYTMLIDDDTIFTVESDLQSMLNILETTPEINLVAGLIKGNKHYGVMHVDGDILYKVCGESKRKINGNKIFDIVVNLFIARTDKLKQTHWCDELKICEHTEYFYRYRDTLTCTVDFNTLFINTSERNDTYTKYRDRVEEYMKLQCNIIGVEEIKLN